MKPAINHEAWANTLIQFIRAKGLEHELKDWCGGWPCPIVTETATDALGVKLESKNGEVPKEARCDRGYRIRRPS